VIVTQTEQVAVLDHYLPRGLEFLTPTGPVDDPRVVDWRDLVARLQQATPCAAIAPTLDALHAGSHVLLINPLVSIGASGSKWATTVAHQVSAVAAMVDSDPGLAMTTSFSMAIYPKPFSAVTGVLFTKGTGKALCG
jgi:Tfp pilus assembly protein PilW